MNSTAWWIGGSVAAVILSALLFKNTSCNSTTTTNDTLVNVNQTVPPTKVITLMDSTKVMQQELLIVQSQATIQSLEDSLERVTTQLASVAPDILVRYKDTFRIQQQALIQTNDTLKRLADSLTALVNDPNKQFIPVPSTFGVNKPFYLIRGRIGRTVVDLDTIELYNKTSLIVGTTGKWYEPKTITVTVVNTNPYIHSSGIESYEYTPKEKKISVIAGPTLMYDVKNGGLHYGIGISGGYRIF